MSTHSALYNFLIDFDIDRYLTPFIPRSPLASLPRPLTHWLGYRPTETKEPPALLQWLSMFIATVGGLTLVSATFIYAPGINIYHPPVIVASLGASAVLDYNTVRSPLAQPRNTVFGHTLAAIVGVAIAKLFQMNSDFAHIDWVSGAVGCACASLAMSMTNAVHPPGGATAVLASTQAQIVAMGWWFVPLVLIASLEMLGVALLVNNVLRQYPVYWWTAQECGHNLPGGGKKDKLADEERGEKMEDMREHQQETNDAKSLGENSDSDGTLHRELSNRLDFVPGLEALNILPDRIELPPHVELDDEETSLLHRLQTRLRAPKPYMV